MSLVPQLLARMNPGATGGGGRRSGLLSILGDDAAVYGCVLFLGLPGVLCLAVPIDTLSGKFDGRMVNG
jgi:hypothetical protein